MRVGIGISGIKVMASRCFGGYIDEMHGCLSSNEQKKEVDGNEMIGVLGHDSAL